jgi:UDP-galactopyranose mutase
LAQPDVTFVGRLATYRYYNMDQVVGQALATYRKVFASSVRRDDPSVVVPARVAAE